MELIPTSKVAEILKVSSSTVINWSRKGFIPCLSVNYGGKKGMLFSKDAIDELSEELNQIKDAEVQLKKAKQKYDNLLKEYQADQKALRQVNGFGRILISTSCLLPKILELCTPIKELAYNQAKAIRMYAEGASLEEIGGELDVSRERARQIACKAARVLACKMNIFDEQKETIKKQQNEISVLKIEIKRLQDANAKLALDLSSYGHDIPQNAVEDKGVIYDRVVLLQTRISDIPGMSVRALNCMKSAKLETLEELVQFRKTDLLKFRNMGKKTLRELEDLLNNNYGLYFGMDVYKYTHELTNEQTNG